MIVWNPQISIDSSYRSISFGIIFISAIQVDSTAEIKKKSIGDIVWFSVKVLIFSCVFVNHADLEIFAFFAAVTVNCSASLMRRIFTAHFRTGICLLRIFAVSTSTLALVLDRVIIPFDSIVFCETRHFNLICFNWKFHSLCEDVTEIFFFKNKYLLAVHSRHVFYYQSLHRMKFCIDLSSPAFPFLLFRGSFWAVLYAVHKCERQQRRVLYILHT